MLTRPTYGRLVEADGTAVAVGHEDFGIAVGKLYAYYLIALTDYNGFLALDVHAGIFGKRCLLDYALAGGKHKIVGGGKLGILKILASDESVDRIARLDVEQVLNSASLRVFGTLGEFVDLHLVDHAALGEEEKVCVHRCRINVLDEILFACIAAARAYAATVLCAKLRQRSALDIAHVRDGDV